MTTITDYFSPKQGTFFQFSKKDRGDLPLTPCIYVPVMVTFRGLFKNQSNISDDFFCGTSL